MGVEERPSTPAASNPQWYAVRCEVGREESVRDTLLARIKALKLEEQIADVLIPTEKITEIRSGRKQVRDRKRFSGYLLVRMLLTDENQRVVREIPGMGEFLSTHPMEPNEVQRILMEQFQGQEERPHVKIGSSGCAVVLVGAIIALLIAGFIPWMDCPACGIGPKIYSFAPEMRTSLDVPHAPMVGPACSDGSGTVVPVLLAGGPIERSG